MASGGRGPGWRDEAAASLLLRHLPSASVAGPVLVMEDPGRRVPEGLTALGLEVVRWSRWALGGNPASVWPPPGPFGTVVLRLPRSKDALAMCLHAAGSVMAEGGSLLVYGAKDEGIASAMGPMEDLFESSGTLGVGGRCRVLEGRRGGGDGGFKGALSHWRRTWALDWPGLPSTWVSYPGVFAHGKVDSGTRLLLDSLPRFSPGSRILDFGCGSGVVGAAALARQPESMLDLLDADAIALEAARENVPEARTILADGLMEMPQGPYDAIVSNPPFHRGKEEDPEMIRALIRLGGRVLRAQGTIILVTQSRIPLEETLRFGFRAVSVLARASGFTVWEGKRPTGGPGVAS